MCSRYGEATMAQMQNAQRQAIASGVIARSRVGSVFDGSLSSMFPPAFLPRNSALSAADNPMPLGDYDAAVRSAVPPVHLGPTCAERAQLEARFFAPVGEFMPSRTNPVPDPTLMARQPTFADANMIDRTFVPEEEDILRINPKGAFFNV